MAEKTQAIPEERNKEIWLDSHKYLRVSLGLLVVVVVCLWPL